MKRFVRYSEGQGLVEMALVLPILLLLFMGIFEFGRILGAYMVINNLAREGARYGVVGHDDTEIVELIDTKRLWLDTSKLEVNITPYQAERTKGNPLEVRVGYSIDLVTPVMSEILPDPVILSTSCSMRVEY